MEEDQRVLATGLKARCGEGERCGAKEDRSARRKRVGGEMELWRQAKSGWVGGDEYDAEGGMRGGGEDLPEWGCV
ncbi:hypothetical protein Tco_0969393 [Tanacetum coccineum]